MRENDRGAGATGAGAVLTCGPVVLLDGWALSHALGTRAAGLVLLLMVPVLLGAGIGAGTAPSGSPPSARLLRAGTGALVAHLLLAALLLVLFALHRPADGPVPMPNP
ncbi:hypothetical protein [Kitasatospora phosalacinea]|uniref:hypothetical protein n=1 Tax=Kitasatospora phosalacinea TaxID=2065 RepID=UPI00131BA3FD|nr:hypothetical protein [Kitasatospora phosalacinea]